MVILLVVALFAVGRAQWSEPERLQGPINDDPSTKTWPSINATGDTLFYAKEGENGNENICFSYRMDDSTWSGPQLLGPQINTPQREISPSIGPGDSILYFVTWGRPGGYGDYDIWYSRRGQDGQWGDPINAGPNVNTSAMEWGVFLSRDGHSLYFSSDRYPAEFLDIYKSEWQDSGGWGSPVRLPGHVNSFSDDENVTLPADESFLILTSWRYYLSSDLYYSRLDSTGWSEATLIPELSTNGMEEGASLTPDGLTVYIASARDSAAPYDTQLYVSHRPNTVLPHGDPLPQMITLEQNYPNPFNPGTVIRFDLPEPARVELKVFNTLGEMVTTLVNENRPAGEYRVTWDGSGFASGPYVCQLRAGKFLQSKKMLLIH